jgi:hypothetical protein
MPYCTDVLYTACHTIQVFHKERAKLYGYFLWMPNYTGVSQRACQIIRVFFYGCHTIQVFHKERVKLYGYFFMDATLYRCFTKSVPNYTGIFLWIPYYTGILNMGKFHPMTGHEDPKWE